MPLLPDLRDFTYYCDSFRFSALFTVYFFGKGSPLGVYIILLIMFSLGQFGCSLFSTYAISVIQARTPEHLMGKVMSYVFTLAMCAQPAGQIIYGALFDWFSDSPYWVLIPSGLLVCVIGLASSKFFVDFEKH